MFVGNLQGFTGAHVKPGLSPVLSGIDTRAAVLSAADTVVRYVDISVEAAPAVIHEDNGTPTFGVDEKPLGRRGAVPNAGRMVVAAGVKLQQESVAAVWQAAEDGIFACASLNSVLGRAANEDWQIAIVL